MANSKIAVTIKGAATLYEACLSEFADKNLVVQHWPNHIDRSTLKPINSETIVYKKATITIPERDPLINQKVIVTMGYPPPDSLPIPVKLAIGKFDVSSLRYTRVYDSLEMTVSCDKNMFEEGLGSPGKVGDGWVNKWKEEK